MNPELKLPVEIIEMILMHCDDPLELSLVSPTFNDIISRSLLLMSHLTVDWFATSTKNWGFIRKFFHRDCPFAMHSAYAIGRGLNWWDWKIIHQPCQYNTKVLLQSDRKYQSLQLLLGKRDQWPQLSVFIKRHEKTLKYLEKTQHFELEPCQHFEMLSILSGNLRTLLVHHLPEEVAFFGALEFPNLQEFEWIGKNIFNFQDWRTPKLKKFICHTAVSDALPSGSYNLVTFLREQPQLEHLGLRNADDIEIFVKAAELSPFAFNLKKLEFCCFTSSIVMLFVESQKKSLKNLCLGWFYFNSDHLSRTFSLELEELELIDVQYESDATPILNCTTIKRLYFQSVVPEHFPSNNAFMIAVIKSCPNLVTLAIDGHDLPKEISKAIASSKIINLNLENVSITFPLDELDQYPSVENFAATSVKKEAVEHFIKKNPQLLSVSFDCDDKEKDIITYIQAFGPLVLNFIIVSFIIGITCFDINSEHSFLKFLGSSLFYYTAKIFRFLFALKLC